VNAVPKLVHGHRVRRANRIPPGAARARRKFLRVFPKGFADETYIEWERGYKWAAHERWRATLGRADFERLLETKRYTEIAARAVSLESRTNLLFSFEKMALRDAVRGDGAPRFANGLFEWIYGSAPAAERFTRWIEVVDGLPRRQTRVLTWPVVTVFGFLAQPSTHCFLKPAVTRTAAQLYGFDFVYHSRPSWRTYRSLLDFARQVGRDVRDLRPRDLIDIQSFIWVQGSDEY
jgi:hypothetical protein